MDRGFGRALLMMSQNNSTGEDFGCESCWPSDVDAALAAIKSSPTKAVLIDEAHYIVSIRHCTACDQDFLGITTEMIDWEAGEDPISRSYVPITESERDMLFASTPPTEAILNAVGPGRRSLIFDWPKDHPPSTCWSTGIRVGPHD